MLDLTLPSLKNTHVIVVGDLMVDRYWYGDALRISQEAPVPVVHVNEVEDRPGGAANVALNTVALGAKATLIGVVGDDDTGRNLKNTLEAAGVVCDFLISPDYPTTTKLRVMSQKQQLIRTDFETLPDKSVDDALAVKLGQAIAADCEQVIILEDYDKGSITDPQVFLKVANEKNVSVVVDPKNKAISEYAGAAIVKPNLHEFLALSGAVGSDEELVEKARLVAGDHNIAALVVTRGGEGMTVVTIDEAQHIPARPTDVFDVTGAGDTAVAVLGVSCALGRSAFDGAKLANIAAGIAVAKSGTATVSGPELMQALAAATTADTGVMNEEQLVAAVTRAKAAGETVVFTNGCFDILHAGHVAYLREAKALGQRLVVALNDDASVKKLKGESRPVNTLVHRQAVLAGLASVDWVTSFSADTPCQLLELIQPDVLVKGGDYGENEVVGADLVQAYGGEVKVLQLVDDVSTTSIVTTILKSAE